MPAPLKVCPFCMVDARTDASSCVYCGSSYDRVGTARRVDEPNTRRRTYNGTSHCAGRADALISLE